MTAPATLYVDAAQLAVVVDRLKVGGSAIYAHGPACDPAHPTVKLVTALREAGTVRPSTFGRDAAGQLRYGVVKLSGSAAAMDARADGKSDDRSARFKLEAIGLTPPRLRDALRLVDLIADHARKGLICPSSADVAAMLNLRDRHSADYLFDKLNQAKVIERWSRGREGRVVALVGTRLRTSDPHEPAAARGNLESARLDYPGLGSEIKKVFK